MPRIESLLKEARKKLVEMGTRNRLIHVNRKASRGNFLNIINERSDDVFKILRLNSKKMKFAGKGDEQDESAEDGIFLEEIIGEDFDEGRFTDSVLETPLTPDALQKRLLRLFKNARTAEEEQGINILYLAMGFVRWYEDDKSNVLRETPLILMPVELVRNNKTSTFDIACRDDDIVTNLSLQERFKIDFGITLPDIDDSIDWNPSSYFSEVKETISGKDRWTVDTDGMQLGFFSFAKLMMLRDLDPQNWDEESLLENKLISGLLAEGFDPDPPLFCEDDNLDAKFTPDQILHVVDADASQTKVIEEVRAGKNLVVQGPPGTGKSQTITNILAAAVYDGKKVLFIAEKMAALEVVYSRMCKVGLKDLCLELHSRSANKKIFLQELSATIYQSNGVKAPELSSSELKNARDKLNMITGLLHESLPDRDYAAFDVLASLVRFASKGVTAPRFGASKLESITKFEKTLLFKCLDDYLNVVNEFGLGQENPFFGATNLDLQPTDLHRLTDEIHDAIRRLENWGNYQNKLEEPITEHPELTLNSAENSRLIYQVLKNSPDSSLQFLNAVHANHQDARFKDALWIADEWISYKRLKIESIADSAWNTDLDSLRDPILKGVGSIMSRIFGKYRSASKQLATYLKLELPKGPVDRLKALDEIIAGREKRKSYEVESEFLKLALGKDWRDERTQFSEVLEVVTWFEEASKQLLEFSSEKLSRLIKYERKNPFDDGSYASQRVILTDAIQKVHARLGMETLSKDSMGSFSLGQLVDILKKMGEHVNSYTHWTRYQFSRTKLLEFEVADLLGMLDHKEIKYESASCELEYAISEARWEYARSSNAEFRELSRLDRHALVSNFSTLERQRVKDTQTAIRDQHLSQVPKGSAGEMGLIRGEIAKKRNHRPIRQMMLNASEMIQKIKPVFLMSPISVAQFLPPGSVEFDLLVIDEASQVKPEDALGSIARAKQIVVVGDQKQLPPTSFFERLTDNMPLDDELDDMEPLITRAIEMESVLSLCEARGLNQSMLEWHYRSRDPSLIAVSNFEFYKNRLILPPCPTESDDNFGLKLTRVSGVYSTASKGGGRPTTNRIEAEKITDRLRELAVRRPEFSVGIVTFSKSQADMVTEVLEYRRRQDDVLDQFLREDKNENVFVKNIENVQGDERDIILISVGYGPHEADGRLVSMSFGPINSEGGERRLNVLFSRSRIACEVFTSFDPGDIDVSRTSKEGPVVLKKFLEYAKTGVLPQTFISEGEADSEFEVDVADVIRSFGYEVDYQVGTAGFKIDLGVKDPKNPEHHILAVECDGATYHSALWARERDRLRQEVLEGFGWEFYRIWSTDWFYRRESEIKRLESALKNAVNRDILHSLKGSNKCVLQASTEITHEDVIPAVLEEASLEIPKYKKATIVLDEYYEPHDRPILEVIELIYQIVSVEGPIHTNEIARRYANAHDKSRVGSRISNCVQAGLIRAEKENLITFRDDFWGLKSQFLDVPIRDRTDETIPLTSAENISSFEIRACASLIQKESGFVDDEELVRVIAKTLGFKRAGPEFQAQVMKSIKKE